LQERLPDSSTRLLNLFTSHNKRSLVLQYIGPEREREREKGREREKEKEREKKTKT